MLNSAVLRHPTPRLSRAALWTGVCLCGLGFALHASWRALPVARFGESLLLAALAAGGAWVLRRATRWSWAAALGVLWLAALVWMGGVLPALAVALLVAGALAVGTLACGTERPWLALVVGLALLAGMLGWLLPFAVHRWWTYAPALALLAGWRAPALRAAWRQARADWHARVAAAPRAAAWTVLLLGLASTGAWLPTMQFDDLAYHLGLPWQLAQHGRYALDATDQAWALAPWASDVLQAVPQVIARQEARGALNVAWLLATAAGVDRLAALLGGRAAARWTAVAWYASLPLVAALLGGMQTETAAAATTVWLAVLAAGVPARRDVVAGAALFGLLWALKPMHGIAATPLFAWLLWRARACMDHRLGAAALALAFGVGGASYAYAWARTGNPVLPLFNGVFHAPQFAPTDFADPRWQAGLAAGLPWDITFGTHRYLEGWDGGFGFVLVALAGAWLVALADARTRALASCASLAIVLPLAMVQYARYLVPGLVALLPALAVVLHARLTGRQALAVAVALCAANLAFQANANWLLHTGAVKRSLAALGDDAPLFARYAPERALIARLRNDAPAATSPVLLLDANVPAHAELAGRGRTIAWYAPRWQAAAAAAEADPSGVAWARLLRAQAVGDVLLRPAALTEPQRRGLARAGARRRAVVGAAEWWSLPGPGA